ncbi:MAG: hypothetical protein BGO14_01410 [Chlamydiales bacterium 38-26]|nr:Brp/Blh family beta-carotene 15,15'-dioxygenase [Chlamydiales bacterium]OJV08105.1 MAG: hypothetical protein BGO14_01410 [Chlamydiales bacterium 38-26]
MIDSKTYRIHQIVFIFLATLVCFLPLTYFKSFSNFQIFLTLLLFFGLGIPHGALDLSLGKKLLQPRFGSCWSLIFILGYLLCGGIVVIGWIFFPLYAFLFFLAISVFHFGFSDRLYKEGWLGTWEGLARGLLPITVPAYFYPNLFQRLVESSLSVEQTLLLIKIIQLFFYSDLILLLVVILEGFWKMNKSAWMNSIELLTLFILFRVVEPFTAFLIYFCFLHSCKHILYVLEEMHKPLKLDTIKWLIVQALPATLTTLVVLLICYWSFEHETMDIPLMLNLFFISLAALTLPHMIVVEASKKI